MVAAPYKGTVSLKGISGDTYVEAFSCSDVQNAYATFDSTGLTFMQLPEAATIVDIVAHTGGTDTTKLKLWVNGLDKGKTWLVSSILDTINNRVPLPINIGNPQRAGGPQLQLKQIA